MGGTQQQKSTPPPDAQPAILGHDAERAVVSDTVGREGAVHDRAPFETRKAVTRRIDALRKINQAEQDVRKRRRYFRSVLFFIITILILLIWGAVTLTNQAVAFPREYDPAGTVAITTLSCDIIFESGSSPTITYRALARLARVHNMWVADTSSGLVTGVSAYNSLEHGCASMPYGQCERLCQLRISVPSGATTTFLVSEPSNGAIAGSWPRLIVERGVSFTKLRMRASSLSTHISEASIDTIDMWGKAGTLRAINTNAQSLSIRSFGSGSVYILDHPAFGVDVLTTWRQASNRLCLASNQGVASGAVIVEEPSEQLCDFTGLIDGTSTDNYLLYSYSQAHYDTNQDGRVSKAEFTTGMTDFTCCGSMAPHYCNCEEWAYRVFPPTDTNLYDRFDLTFENFFQYLLALNLTRLVGKPASSGCFEGATAHTPGATTTRPISASSTGGEVVITLQQAAVGAGQPYHVQDIYAPEEGRVAGWRMLHADADRLRAAYGGSVGDRGSTGEVYLTIDGYEMGSAYPTTRWIYVTHPMMLIVPLPILSFFSFGGLRQTVAHEVVTFLNNDCHLDEFAGNDTLLEQSRNETLAQMHAQLVKSLKSSAWDTSELRGQLVLQTFTDAWSWANPLGLLEYFPLTAVSGGPDDRERHMWEDSSLKLRLRLAMGLSVGFGFLGGLFIYGFILLRIKRVRVLDRVRREANKVMTLLRHYPHLSIKQLRRKVRASEDDHNWDALWTELEQPFELLRLIFVSRLERAYVNSIDRFLEERMVRVDNTPIRGLAVVRRKVVDILKTHFIKRTASAWDDTDHLERVVSPTHDSEASQKELSGEFIYMRKIFREYELYCLENDLIIQPKRDVFQRRLVAKYNVRVKQLTVSRIRGVVWKQEVIDQFEAASRDKEDVPQNTFRLLRKESSLSLLEDMANSTGKAPTLPPAGWMRKFIADMCIVTKQPGDWIDLKTRAGPSGGTRPGLQRVVMQWCHKHGYASAQLLKHSDWTKDLPAGVRLQDEIRVRQVYGVKFKGQVGPTELFSCRLHGQWFLFETIDMLVHFIALLIFTAPWAVVAIHINTEWAQTIAPNGGSMTPGGPVLPPLLWHDVVRPLPALALIAGATAADGNPTVSGYSLSPLSSLFLWEAVAFGAATLLRMMVGYFNPPVKAMKAIVAYGYGVIAQIHLIFIASLLTMMSAWFLVATVLKPKVYLPYGVAVIATFVAARTVASSMIDAGRRLTGSISDAVRKQLRLKLVTARQQFEQAASEQLLQNSAARDDSFEAPLGPVSLDTKAADKEVTAADIFALLRDARDAGLELAEGEDSSDWIARKDFQHLFIALDLNLSDGQLDRLFAMIDLNGNERISLEEFEGAWEVLSDEIIQESVRELGLAPTQIALVTFLIVLSLVALFAFVLLVLGAWLNEDDFGAVVQSLLVGFTGKAVTDVRKTFRGKAEEGQEQIDKLVAAFMSEQEDAATEE